MSDHKTKNPGHPPRLEQQSTTEALPVAPSLGPALAAEQVGQTPALVDSRVVLISAVSVVMALAASLIAQALVKLIGLITNISFYGKFSTDFVSPAGNTLGLWVIAVPVIGGIIVGLMARYGSKAIRGHGIPEAMEQVLLNESRIPARVMFLKPISAAFSIGTGGPFGAEGPIIATGGALGSVIGQLMRTTASERKTLLAAGAAAGMTATFGSPVSAVLLAVELLLFEFRARSIIPVALACATAAATRISLVGFKPVFEMPDIGPLHGSAIAFYILMGALVGVASVWVTKVVYWIEDLFDELPIHWMWWPALGAVAVGVVGYFYPRTMGVGYDNIEHILSGSITGQAMVIFCIMKLVSWSISLGSGTSGGTLAPLFTIGGGLGAALGLAMQRFLPLQGIDPRVAALVGMAAIFAGASRALLASVVFAFETTHQQMGLLPLLGGCTASYLISALMMRNTIMTEKIARRGVRVPAEYAADFLEQVLVRDHCSQGLVAFSATTTLGEARRLVQSNAEGYGHQGFPVVAEGELRGVVTRRDFLNTTDPDALELGAVLKRVAVTIFDDASLREAADLMTRERIGRLVVVARAEPRKPLGMLTRSDILGAHRRRLAETHDAKRTLSVPGVGRLSGRGARA